jgi:putative nucleotidyltransferase with HDIG domain
MTPNDIEEIFSDQLSSIESKDVREKVVQAWVEACRQGGWETAADLKAVPFTLLTNCRGISLVEHTIAVTEGALALADAQESAYSRMPYSVNLDRLIAGGLLHDVGKLLETEKDGDGAFRRSGKGTYAGHATLGAILAAQVGLPDGIVNTIACHNREGESAPRVLETVLIHQADFATLDPLVMLAEGRLLA